MFKKSGFSKHMILVSVLHTHVKTDVQNDKKVCFKYGILKAFKIFRFCYQDCAFC